MGLTRVKVVLRTKKGEEEGYLKIRTTANRTSRYKTLGIKIHRKYWHSEREEVRKTYSNHESLNKFIKEEVRKHHIYGKIPTYTLSDKIIDLEAYFLRNIENTNNPGTKNVKRATYKKFSSYLLSIGMKNFGFSDISPDHIQRFYNFLRNRVSSNTAGHHIKILKIVVNRAVKDGVIPPYPYNPFGSIKLRYVEPSIKGLTSLQVNMLQQNNFYNPNKYLSMFLFSLFAQGMRKSDVLLLRWENLEYSYEKLILKYIVRKTQEVQEVKLSPLAVYYLRLQLFEIKPSLREKLSNLEKKINYHQQKLKELNDGFLAGQSDSNIDKNMENEVSFHEVSIAEYENDVYMECSIIAQEQAIKNPKVFLFDCLRGEKISKYMNDEEEFKILDRKAKLYNYHLKKLGEKEDIKGLHPHLSRHTYLYLVNSTGANLQVIQALAGHKDPKQTQAYLRRLIPDSGDEINNKLSRNFMDFN